MDEASHYGTTESDHVVGNNPSIPVYVTEQWVEEALSCGFAEYQGGQLFVRPYPNTSTERAWLTDNHGLSIPGRDGIGYVYHGTTIESLPKVLKQGLFGVPEHPTISGYMQDQVHAAAIGRESRIHKGMVVVWKTDWQAVEGAEGSWPEPMGWPRARYEGSREELELGNHLKFAEDLRWLPPDDILGIFVVEQPNHEPSYEQLLAA